jgi:hypothetical protein
MLAPVGAPPVSESQQQQGAHNSRDANNSRTESNSKDARNVGNTSCRRDVNNSRDGNNSKDLSFIIGIPEMSTAVRAPATAGST